MPAHRFFVDTNLAPNEPCFLLESEHHHLSHVMRMAEKEMVELVNGKGSLAVAEITRIGKHKTELFIQSVDTKPSQLPRLGLAIPFLRPSKLEWILEKGTELGVDEFLLYPAIHSETKIPSAHQLERFHTLIISALKQSGRLFLPQLSILPNLTSILQRSGSLFFCDPKAQTHSPKATSHPMIFITGPERGFHENELKTLKDKKIEGIQLSPHILRAETAPIVAAAQMQWA
jgi:16S rRNA (uracil1498-N3)-methyltransferase